MLGHEVVGNTSLSRYVIFLTIAVLAERDLTPSVMHLVAATGFTKAAISKCARELMEQGLLREQIDPQDRRLRQLSLTTIGKRRADLLMKGSREIWARVAALDDACGPWPVADRVSLQHMVGRLRASAKPKSRGRSKAA